LIGCGERAGPPFINGDFAIAQFHFNQIAAAPSILPSSLIGGAQRFTANFRSDDFALALRIAQGMR
jgi:hypothetical protein